MKTAIRELAGKLTNMKIKSKLDGKDVYFYQFNYDYFICPEQAVGGNLLVIGRLMGRRLPYPPAVLRKRSGNCFLYFEKMHFAG